MMETMIILDVPALYLTQTGVFCVHQTDYTCNPTRVYFNSFRRPRSWELRTQKLKCRQVRAQSVNVLPLRPGVGQCIAIHATLTARDVLLCLFLPFWSIRVHFFPKTSPDFSCVGCG